MVLWIIVAFVSCEDSPQIVLPYSPDQTELLAVIKNFSTSPIDGVNVRLFDCWKYPASCASKNLFPGHIYSSLPPFPLSQSNRPITLQSLQRLGRDLQVNNVHQFDAINDVVSAANNSSLFCLITRPNAGDLSVKQNLLQNIAKRLVHRDVSFCLITDPVLYEQFGRYPLTTFVYVSPNLRYDTLKGDLTIDTLVDFVNLHEHKHLNPPIARLGLSLVLVGESLTEAFGEFEGQIPIVFVNESSKPFLAQTICRGESHCNAVVNFAENRAIVIKSESDIEQAVRNFGGLWMALGIIERWKTRIALQFLMNPSPIGAIAIGIVTVLAIFFLNRIDRENVIADNRVHPQKAKKRTTITKTK
jgi:hypothetical protein